MNKIDKLTQKFLDSPTYLKNGAGFLSEQWDCTKDEIYAAKEMARRMMDKMGEIDDIKLQKPNITDEELTKYTGSESTSDGCVKRFETTNPLTPEEIEKLAGVDNINTYVARVWDKMLPSGKWVYSIDVRYRVKDFYTKDQLAEKIKSLMPDLKPHFFSPSTKMVLSNQALIICLADDHVGAVNVTNIFDNEGVTYEERLDKVFEEVMALDNIFEEVHVISLGDQMNGWSSQTTRGGHEVKSLSNKEQFDIYVDARIKFYNKLFTSGVGESYFVHDVENSNHSGLGMSYMANKTIEMYLEGRFPQVYRESTLEAFGGFQYGQHVIIFGHGKDEKFQKRPMPATLNAQTDLYLYDYIQNKGYSPYKDKITFYKGDLHQLGLQMGKFGRYINVQSLAGNSDYGDINFGNTKGGALLEIVDKNSYKVKSQPIWF